MNPAGPNMENNSRGVFTPVTVVQIDEDPILVKDHVLWSLCSFYFMNCFCLGLIALWYSIRSRDQKVAKNLQLARMYGDKAKRFNIIALVILGVSILIAIITGISISVAAHNYVSSYRRYY
ncbi:dispanin subfamily A member 2b-like [Erpetoichthys calabaricus]|uniref:dispanin subfamily A member 2b-like n=1 Tax=Erpetoichthys calabaricus TaxID=27687 RepID=UPI00109FB38B|nr:dispanin subfamily A member 2b-like [Erpetoichthys calabaricus]